jgi:hypothetical protein
MKGYARMLVPGAMLTGSLNEQNVRFVHDALDHAAKKEAPQWIGPLCWSVMLECVPWDLRELMLFPLDQTGPVFPDGDVLAWKEIGRVCSLDSGSHAL